MLVADILDRDENEMLCCSIMSFPFVREKLYRGLQLQDCPRRKLTKSDIPRLCSSLAGRWKLSVTFVQRERGGIDP